MANELIINASLPETRIALMEDGEIQELLIERASGKGITGNIYKGRVTRVLPGMQAAFVDIGLEKAAFLYVDDVFVHSEIFEEEEGPSAEEGETTPQTESADAASTGDENSGNTQNTEETPSESASEAEALDEAEALEDSDEASEEDSLEDLDDDQIDDEDDGEDDGDDESDEPARMAPPPGGDDNDDEDNIGNRIQPSGTIAPPSNEQKAPVYITDPDNEVPVITPSAEAQNPNPNEMGVNSNPEDRGRRFKRGRRGGRNRNKRRDRDGGDHRQQNNPEAQLMADQGERLEGDSMSVSSDRADLSGDSPEAIRGNAGNIDTGSQKSRERPEFRENRNRDRKIRPRSSSRPMRQQVNIQDLLQEGQEVIVQVAKDPIATKGARLTCHISLPGRHLVCMPTIDHVGVSRRIDSDQERRKLREFVENNRPKNLGFIVRTAGGKGANEKRIKQDIEYLSRLWDEIREKAANSTAPALIYEDLNAVLRSIRDWVTEDIDKIVVDSRYHFNDIMRFCSHFMPSLRQKVELYHGDIPIFDAYGISTELSRGLERKVWLKSGGYIVIDQAEALVAIDVNTGRYVGKKNLEDTIIKTNLEAVKEIAYQLRLRNCGGIIILDLIDMEKEENKQRVYRALEEELKKDRARPSILKISELGLVEMTRKRTRDTIIRTLCESCTHCEGKSFIKTKQTVAYEVLREIEREGIERDINKILVQAHPEVVDILAIDERETLDQLERRYRKTVYLQAITDFHPEQFEVSSDKKDKATLSPREDRSGRNRWRGRDQNRDQNRERRDRDSQNNPSETGLPVPLAQPIGDRAATSEDSENRPIIQAKRREIIIPAQSVSDLNGSIQMPSNNFSQEEVLDSASGEADEADDSIEPGNSIQDPPPPSFTPARDHFESEEDRLAYMRAQAAQDAALSGRPTNNQSRFNHRGGGGGRDDRGGRNNRKRRGGRFQPRGGGRPNNNRFGGPRPEGRPQPLGGGAPVNAAPASSGDSSGNGGNDSGDNS